MAACNCETKVVTENEKTDEEKFICKICIGHYRNPRYLPTCGHTFCENCLLKYTRTIQQEDQGSKCGCPVCRKPYTHPEHDEVTLQWIQTFPLNTVIIKMMESLPQSGKEMKEERRMCDPCKEDGETNVGLTFCLDCKEVLCTSCTKFHKNLKLTKRHKHVDIRELSSQVSLTDYIRGVGKCAVHLERDIEIYCKKHDAVACALCLISGHKSCELIDIACHNIDPTKLQIDSEMLISRMKSAMIHCNGLHKLRRENNTNLKQNLKQIRENIKLVRDEVVELMNNVVKHVSDVTNKMEVEIIEDGIDADTERVTDIQKLTAHNIAFLTTIQQHGSEKHKFVSANLIQNMFEVSAKQIAEEDKHMKQLDAELVIADNLKKLLDSTDVEKLVEIKVTESESRHTPLASVLTPPRDTGAETLASVLTPPRDTGAETLASVLTPPRDTGAETLASVLTPPRDTGAETLASVLTPPRDTGAETLASVLTPPRDTGAETNVLRDRKLVKAEEHSVRLAVSHIPRYSGVNIYRDGKVILTDCRAISRNIVCLYNPANKTILKLTLGSCPCSSAQIDNSHFAVSCTDMTITIVSVGNELRQQKILPARYTPRSIVALNTGQLAVAWDYPPAFGVIDVTGTEIVHKSYFDRDTCGRTFKHFMYLAVDEERQHVIQPCTVDIVVYCFDFKGNPVFKYTHAGLTNPQGVALDNGGNVYVCDNSTHSIHKLSPTGGPISVITENVPPHPLAICSDVTGTGFWVTRRSAPRDKVVYFRLQQTTD